MTTRIGGAVVPSLDGFPMTFLIAVVAAVVSLAITALIPRPSPAPRRLGNN